MSAVSEASKLLVVECADGPGMTAQMGPEEVLSEAKHYATDLANAAERFMNSGHMHADMRVGYHESLRHAIQSYRDAERRNFAQSDCTYPGARGDT